MKSRAIAVLFLLLLVNIAYVAAFAFPTIFYMGNVVLHLVLGIAFIVTIVVWARRDIGAATIGLLIGSAIFGLYLAWYGNVVANRWALTIHVLLGGIFVALITMNFLRARPQWRPAFIGALALLILLPPGAALYRRAFPNPHDVIRN